MLISIYLALLTLVSFAVAAMSGPKPERLSYYRDREREQMRYDRRRMR